MTFTHLPARAIVRIFTLGERALVRTLIKNDPSQFAQRDLTNEKRFTVVAGMYLVYLEMPEIGATKILKLGVIPEDWYIDRY